MLISPITIKINGKTIPLFERNGMMSFADIGQLAGINVPSTVAYTKPKFGQPTQTGASVTVLSGQSIGIDNGMSFTVT